MLGEELSAVAERYFDITAEGNFEGANILHRTISIDEAARLYKKTPQEMERAIGEIRRRLFEARERQNKPARDKKSSPREDGMMIGALAEGFRALGDERYLRAAARGAEFVMGRLWGRPRAQALVQGRRRAFQRLPGGLRAVRGQSNRSLRSLARRPLSPTWRRGRWPTRSSSASSIPKRAGSSLPRPTMSG